MLYRSVAMDRGTMSTAVHDRATRRTVQHKRIAASVIWRLQVPVAFTECIATTSVRLPMIRFVPTGFPKAMHGRGRPGVGLRLVPAALLHRKAPTRFAACWPIAEDRSQFQRKANSTSALSCCQQLTGHAAENHCSAGRGFFRARQHFVVGERGSRAEVTFLGKMEDKLDVHQPTSVRSSRNRRTFRLSPVSTSFQCVQTEASFLLE